MRLFPRFRADYSEGWSKSRLDPLAPAQAQAPDTESVTVTGSRIQIQGYEAPTPVTVIGVEHDLFRRWEGELGSARNAEDA